MRSGKKNTVVDIMRATIAVDANYNTDIPTLAAWKSTVFCVSTPRRGREVADQGQVISETYMKFDFEYFDVVGILPTDVIRCDGVDYDIKAILPDLALKEWIAVDTVSRPPTTGRT